MIFSRPPVKSIGIELIQSSFKIAETLLTNEHTTLIAEILPMGYIFQKKRPVNHEEKNINIFNWQLVCSAISVGFEYHQLTSQREGLTTFLGETSQNTRPWEVWWLKLSEVTLENLLCLFVDKCQYIIMGINSAEFNYDPSKEGLFFGGLIF